MTCGKEGQDSWEVAPPWFQTTRLVARIAVIIVLLPYGPNTTFGRLSIAARTAAAGSAVASRISSSTPVHGDGKRAAYLAHKVSPVALARPNVASEPLNGVTSAARSLLILVGDKRFDDVVFLCRHQLKGPFHLRER